MNIMDAWKWKGKFLISDGSRKHYAELGINAEKDWSVYTVRLDMSNKTAPLYLQYRGRGEIDFLKLELEEIK